MALIIQNNFLHTISNMTHIWRLHLIMKISNWELNILKQILKEEKEFNVKNEMQLVKAYLFKKEYLLTKENELFLTLDSIIELNNIILNKKNQSL